MEFINFKKHKNWLFLTIPKLSSITKQSTKCFSSFDPQVYHSSSPTILSPINKQSSKFVHALKQKHPWAPHLILGAMLLGWIKNSPSTPLYDCLIATPSRKTETFNACLLGIKQTIWKNFRKSTSHSNYMPSMSENLCIHSHDMSTTTTLCTFSTKSRSSLYASKPRQPPSCICTYIEQS